MQLSERPRVSEVIQSPQEHDALWAAFNDSEYRHAFAEGFVGDFLANQIYSLRANRDWNQSELADLAGVSQPQISKWESSCEGVRLDSMLRVAEAFDLAFVAKFVSFSELAREVICARSSAAIPSFDDESSKAIRQPSIRFSVPEPNTRRSRRGQSVGDLSSGQKYCKVYASTGTR